nr:unnamed protein product [Callosobruchus chinensis]
MQVIPVVSALVNWLPSVSRDDNKYHTFKVLDSIMGSGMSSRLFQEVREKQGLLTPFTHSTLAMLIRECFRFLLVQIVKLSTDDLKEEEVNRVKERVKSQILMSRESVSSRAETLGHYYGNYNKYISKNELIEKISAVTIYDIKKAAEELLSQHEELL